MGIDIVSVFNPPQDKSISWRDVFDPKRFFGHYDKVREVAKSVGYSMIAFNGMVYHVNDPDMKAICRVEDIK
jgi:spermidine/putrescine-binding protein